MSAYFFKKLEADQLLAAPLLESLKAGSAARLFSVRWEVKTGLYLGVLLLATGLGILVYKNIDTIGHQVILMFLVAVCAASFFYCFKTKLPFSTGKVESPGSFFDYILLLGCLTFITALGYLQFEYNVFGTRYGLATFIPAVVLFFVAYYFDHIGVLSLAITSLAAWLGISVTPAEILKANDFSSRNIIFTGLAFGVLMVVAAIATRRRNIKAHFAFSYLNFGMHIFFISCLAAQLYFEQLYLVWFLILLAAAYLFYTKLISERQFYFLLFLTLYSYISLTYLVTRFLFHTAGMDIGGVYLSFIYFIGSAVFTILFLVRMNKTLRANDSLR